MTNGNTESKLIIFEEHKVKVSIYEVLDEKDKKKILRIQSEIEERLISIKTNIFEIGKLLHEAKEILPHGRFQRWIEETFGNELPYPTAACYKSIYEMFEDKPSVVKLLPVTFLIQLKQETFPDEIRKLIADNPEAFKQTDINEVEEAYMKFKEGKINMDDFIRLAKKSIDIGMSILYGESHARHALRTKRTIKVGFKQLVDAIAIMQKYSGIMRNVFPPPNEYVSNHNKMVEVINEALDDDLIDQIDLSIKELQNLKAVIENRRQFFKQRLVEENGVVKKAYV